MTHTWVIGAGGLIGRSITQTVPGAWSAPSIPWSDEAGARESLRQALSQFSEIAGDGPWGIVWAAGAGTVAAGQQALDSETRHLRSFLEALRANGPRGTGAFLLASSAGGCFAGAVNPPFDSRTVPAPLGAYGKAKIEQEQLAADVLSDRCPLVLARFSNVYGPHQDLTKRQGLISQLVLAAITRTPINIFVSLDTIRDYVYADDAAVAAAHWLERGMRDQATPVTTRIIASGRSTTVAALIRRVSDVTHRRIPVALGTDASSRAQAKDLRFTPDVPQGRPFPDTPLPVGLKQVSDAILRRVQNPRHDAPADDHRESGRR